MTTLTCNKVQRITVYALGALMISAACVGAAVVPAKAADITVSTASDWQTEVERRIDDAMRSPLTRSQDVVMAEVVMHFDEHGSFRTASLGKTSGLGAVDQEALRVANTIRYPALPVHLQGKPQRVAMQIFFGNDSTKVNRQRAKANEAATALAAKVDADRAEASIAAQPAG